MDWHGLTLGDLRLMSADQNDHLAAFDPMTSAGALSHFFFGRADWPLLLSCFACLWHETIDSCDGVCELAGSEVLHSFAFSWRLRNGIAPHPSVLLADYRASKKKRAAICISDA